MCTQNELNHILKELVNIYRIVYGNRIVKILLYGSYARGEFDEESDVDVVALVKGERETLQDQLHRVWDASSELELQYGTILSPMVIPYDEYKKYVNDLPYYKNIEKEGIELHGHRLA